jgi:archaellum component FlaC
MCKRQDIQALLHEEAGRDLSGSASPKSRATHTKEIDVDIMLKLALLLVGASATLVAFFGETVNKDERRFLQRVRPAGWVALTILAVSLALSVVQAMREAKAERDAKTATDVANKKLAVAEDTISRLGGTPEQLKKLQDENQLLKDSLAEARAKIESQQKDVQRLTSALDSANSEIEKAKKQFQDVTNALNHVREEINKLPDFLKRQLPDGVKKALGI